MRIIVCLSLLLELAAVPLTRAAEALPTQEDLRYQAGIADFTAKMKALNYPALFDQAAAEFNVPPDVLKGVAFAETRWDMLTWPPGETVSPENGMPRPYGIMSLWDNEYFGHSLLDAAALIGQSPDVLKQDALQNMRGGAALLRKLYDENPKPDDTSEADIESWRYAIRKYCGIPEPDLNARHALDVYVLMSQGYHQYGIEWDAHPVNLGPIRAETQRIMAEEQAKRLARMAAQSNLLNAAKQATAANPASASQATNRLIPQVAVANPPATRRGNTWWMILIALALLAGVAVAYRLRSKSSP